MTAPKRFASLNLRKKNMILEAAYREFCGVPYSSVRISSFIKSAGISRASFYLYFKDKEDLYRCMIYGLAEEVREGYLQCLQEQKGNFYRAVLATINLMESYGRREVYVDVYRKMMSEKLCCSIIIDVWKQFHQSGLTADFIEACYQERNKGRYGDLNRDQFTYAMELYTNILERFLMMLALEYPDVEKIKRSLESQLMIVERAMLQMAA